MSQNYSKKPRASCAFCSAPASDGIGMSSDIVMVWCLGRGQHKGIEILEQRLRVLLCDTKGAVE